MIGIRMMISALPSHNAVPSDRPGRHYTQNGAFTPRADTVAETFFPGIFYIYINYVIYDRN